jgi:hypothetical protein
VYGTADDGLGISRNMLCDIRVSKARWDIVADEGLLYLFIVEVEVEVNLRPTVSRPVCLGVRRPSGTSDQFFFLLQISFRHLGFYYFAAPSLKRGRLCNLLYNCFWALPEQSLLGRSPAELTALFYCLIWDSPNLEGQVPVFISLRNRVAQLYPRALGSLLSPLRLVGQRWRYSNRPPHGSIPTAAIPDL